VSDKKKSGPCAPRASTMLRAKAELAAAELAGHGPLTVRQLVSDSGDQYIMTATGWNLAQVYGGEGKNVADILNHAIASARRKP
jgi:hypothetical protein